MADSVKPEVVLLDIGMPIKNGYEVARDIRASSWAKGLTLNAITGWGQDADPQKIKAAGFESTYDQAGTFLHVTGSVGRLAKGAKVSKSRRGVAAFRAAQLPAPPLRRMTAPSPNKPRLSRPRL